MSNISMSGDSLLKVGKESFQSGMVPARHNIYSKTDIDNPVYIIIVLFEMQVVYNACYGGFSLSIEAYKKLGLESPHSFIDRTDPRLIELIKEWGNKRCSGRCANLQICLVPEQWEGCYTLEEYDGDESIRFDKSTWLEKKLRAMRNEVNLPVVHTYVDKILRELEDADGEYV
jgi:hypothetical protein